MVLPPTQTSQYKDFRNQCANGRWIRRWNGLTKLGCFTFFLDLSFQPQIQAKLDWDNMLILLSAGGGVWKTVIQFLDNWNWRLREVTCWGSQSQWRTFSGSGRQICVLAVPLPKLVMLGDRFHPELPFLHMYTENRMFLTSLRHKVG